MERKYSVFTELLFPSAIFVTFFTRDDLLSREGLSEGGNDDFSGGQVMMMSIKNLF